MEASKKSNKGKNKMTSEEGVSGKFRFVDWSSIILNLISEEDLRLGNVGSFDFAAFAASLTPTSSPVKQRTSKVRSTALKSGGSASRNDSAEWSAESTSKSSSRSLVGWLVEDLLCSMETM